MSAVDPQKVASILADVAAQEIVPLFRNLKHGDVRKKAGDETVTVADEAAERALTSRLTALLPGSVAVGEEGAAENPVVMDLLAGDAPVWVIDPVDGTRNFAAGKPEFAVMAALVTRNATLASWIYRPMSGASYVAERGAGAWLNGARMTPPPAPGADNELVGTIRFMFFPEQAREALRAKAKAQLAPFDDNSCAGREYARMAEGRQHYALFRKMKPWDHLPGALIVGEAGGRVAKWDGSAYRPTDASGGILAASSPDAWRRIREFLGQA